MVRETHCAGRAAERPFYRCDRGIACLDHNLGAANGDGGLTTSGRLGALAGDGLAVYLPISRSRLTSIPRPAVIQAQLTGEGKPT
jgi:hypothetical protein